MPFDWFTITAQIINFSILLWLLRRFLYRPILAGLDARETRLSNVLAEANAKNEEAFKHQQYLAQKEAKLQQEVKSIIDKARAEAKEEKLKLLDDAKKTADEMLVQKLEIQQRKLLSIQQQILDQNITEVYAIAGNILEALCDITVEQAIVDKFLIRLNTLDNEDHDALLVARKTTNTLVVRTAFTLSEKYKKSIERALFKILNEQKEASVTINFIRVPKLLAGLEINLGGWEIAWNVDYHLNILQERVSQAIQFGSITQQSKDKPKGEFTHTAFDQ